jgi:alpha-methylacyl-CoA racemase
MGPLNGLRIVEIAGIGPTQLCGMLLADMGASVIRIERPGGDDDTVEIPARYNLMNRSRPGLPVDLKTKEGADLVLRLCDVADAVFEGFRPGTMEKLGLGPDVCMARNEALVYGRMTGWGQDGPLANTAGHDTNYIALSGALGCLGDADRPPPLPLNLVADFGGGALYLAMGLLAALLETSRSGKGQVVDAAMIDGSASMMTMFYGMLAAGMWTDRRQSNLLDGAAPFARTYETADGQYVAVCAIESRFFQTLLDVLAISDIDASEQYRSECWSAHRRVLEAAFRRHTRDEVTRLFEGTDACVSPVLTLSEVPRNAHNEARQTFVTVDGIEQPAPAPRFSRTKSEIGHGPARSKAFARQVLIDWGIDKAEASRLVATTYASPGMG